MYEHLTHQTFLAVKTQYPEHLLLFKIGDFLEAFDEDAVTLARICAVIVTKVRGHEMAGFPFAAAEEYIGKLIDAGKYCAICEPVVSNAVQKGTVPTKVYTQGELIG